MLGCTRTELMGLSSLQITHPDHQQKTRKLIKQLLTNEIPHSALEKRYIRKDDPLDFAMVRAINQMGQLMGKKTIAEYVENDSILEKLREIGVDYAQGYGIGRPQPISMR
ncbi:MAG: EAL domain-containing protein [Gammaproteobacteria bacterium]